MRKTRLIIFLLVCLIALPSVAQTSKVTMTFKNESLPSVFKRLEKATDYKFLFAYEDVGNYSVNGEVKNATIQETMNYVLRDKPLSYTLEGKIVNVQSANEKKSGRMRTIKGYVRDDAGEPLMGVPVCIGETRVCTVTDADGFYTFKIPVERTVLKFSYVGMDNKYEAILQGTADVNRDIVMSSATQLKDVVVTGIFTRKKESFTGSAATYTAKELKDMGTSNVLQSLKTLDPAFAIIEDTQFGSDPNRLPNMEIRGKSSMLGQRDELATDPNQPLFILDGFESSLQAINDLDINRIESITILKDAASTAIYGSKAANGVVVVETVKPKAGQLQVSYTGNFNVTVPDLTSYDMMNAPEKIEFERLSGRYDPSIVETANQTQTAIEVTENYYARLNSIAQGVNTDWLAQPVRIGVNQKHSMYVQGGSETFMFGIGGMYNGNTGVMKGSDREVFSGNLDMIYRVKKFQFSNKFSLSNADYNNPLVAFSGVCQCQPLLSYLR